MTQRYAKSPDSLGIPASLVKVMTGLVARDYLTSDALLDTYATVTSEDSPAGGTDGVALGDVVRLRDAIYMMLINSRNDAAHFVARVVGGMMSPGAPDPYAYFVSQMNAKAAALGYTGAVYYDSHGLSDNNRMTANQVASMMKLLIADGLLYEAAGTWTKTMTTQAGRSITVTNLFDPAGVNVPSGWSIVSGFPFPEHMASKYGITAASGYSQALVWQHPRDGLRVTVVMNATDDTELKRDLRTLINYECARGDAA